jgi:hypothetical protein
MAKPIINHRGPEFRELYRRILDNLKFAFETKDLKEGSHRIAVKIEDIYGNGFWELKLGLPHRLVNQWIRTMMQNPWHRRIR